jgi:hypothetical protein
MKMYKKSDLQFNNGLLITKDGDIVLPDIRIVDQANELETLLQKSKYLASQPEAMPMPSLDGFKRKSITENDSQFTVSTPFMDAKEAEALAIMDEIDDMRAVDEANNMLLGFAAIIDFVKNDYVIDCGDELYRFDTPTIGSVLDLTESDVVNIIATICGMVKEELDDDEEHDEE